jgi:hypothetical protein
VRNLIYTAVFIQDEVVFQHANNLSSGNHWAVESEIFWKARGDHGQFTEAAIACVFKKFMRQLPDGTTQARGWSETHRAPLKKKDRNQSSIAFITVCPYHPHRRTYEH